MALLAGTLTLSGCGGSSDTADTADNGAAPGTQTSQGATSSGADATFANGVISHHTQAVQMADMALAQDSSPKVKELAAAIKAAQGPEIERMSRCLTRWGEMDPETMGYTEGMPGDSMDEPMPGAVDEPVAASAGQMMPEQDLTALSAASGPAFDRIWLTGMTKHLQAEVTLAQTELKNGSDADALQLAREIMSSHPPQIARMQDLLKSLS